MRRLAVFRKILNGQALENLKFKNVMSTWEKCVEKKLVSPKDCCEINCLMDEICHPEGSWKEGYKKKNIKDTRILIAGIVLFTLTLIKLKFTALAKGYPEVTFF